MTGHDFTYGIYENNSGSVGIQTCEVESYCTGRIPVGAYKENK